MKGGKYAKTLAKIQVRGIFRIRDIRRNVFTTLTNRDLYGDAMLVPIRMGTNIAERNQQKHYCYRVLVQRVNLFFEELINIKVIIFLIHELFR